MIIYLDAVEIFMYFHIHNLSEISYFTALLDIFSHFIYGICQVVIHIPHMFQTLIQKYKF